MRTTQHVNDVHANSFPTVRRQLALQAFIYVAITVTLLLFPLTRVVHAESSAIIAGCAFFISGLSVRSNTFGTTFREDIAVSFCTSFIPLAVFSVSTLLILDCGCRSFLEGTRIYLLFVPPSVILGVVLSTCLRSADYRRPKLLFVLTGLCIAIIPVVFTLKFFPQFYLYNHVFGGVLGPVYDEELYVGRGLVVFRFLTFLWVLLLVSMRTRRKKFVTVVALLIALVYLTGGVTGMRGSSARFADVLGSAVASDNFLIYFDSDDDLPEPNVLAAYMEYHHARMSDFVGRSPKDRVEVYLYPSPKVKGRLTGAGTTSVAPVWLRRPQIHMLSSELGRSFDHELAHAFSRDFGGWLTNASSRIGLVEGFAVAMEAPDGYPSMDSQVRVLLADSTASQQYNVGRLEDLVLSPIFWLNRGPVAYSISGSLVKWLIEHFGAERFERIYGGESFDDVYPAGFDVLIADWSAYIKAQPIDPVALSLGTARFSVPSLFEQRCPHRVPEESIAYRRGLEALRAGEIATAIAEMQSSIATNPDYQAPLQQLLSLLVLADRIDEANHIDVPADSVSGPALLMARGDLLLASGRPDSARVLYELALTRTPLFAQTTRQSIVVKENLAGHPIDFGNIFTNDQELTLSEDSLRSKIWLTRALKVRSADPGAAAEYFERALSGANDSEMALIEGQLSVHYYWKGDFGRASRHAQRASELYLAQPSRPLFEYYEYVEDLGRWALQNAPAYSLTEQKTDKQL